MDKTIIKNLVATGIIGIEEHERITPQKIIINIIMFSDQGKAAESDNIDDCVNYHTVAEKVRIHAQTVARFTVEALANDIAEICLAEATVQKVQVRVEKPEAINYTETVGVEIERSKQKD